jgi:hypothetical protein
MNSSKRKSIRRKSILRKSRARKSPVRKSRVNKSRIRKSRIRKSRIRKSRARKSRARKSSPQKSKSIRRKSIQGKSRARKSLSRKSKSIRRKSIRRKSRASKFYSPTEITDEDKKYLNKTYTPKITDEDLKFLNKKQHTVLKGMKEEEKRQRNLTIQRKREKVQTPMSKEEKDFFQPLVFNIYEKEEQTKEALNKLFEFYKDDRIKFVIEVFVKEINELKSRVFEIYESNEKEKKERLETLRREVLGKISNPTDVDRERINEIIEWLGIKLRPAIRLRERKRKRNIIHEEKNQPEYKQEIEREKVRNKEKIDSEKKRKLEAYGKKKILKKNYAYYNDFGGGKRDINVYGQELTGKGGDNYHCSLVNTTHNGKDIIVPHATFAKKDEDTYRKFDPSNVKGQYPYIHYHYGINPNRKEKDRFNKNTNRLVMNPSFWPIITEDPRFAYVNHEEYFDHLDSDSVDVSFIQFGSDILQNKLREKYKDCHEEFDRNQKHFKTLLDTNIVTFGQNKEDIEFASTGEKKIH